jgi:hypothetical protein
VGREEAEKLIVVLVVQARHGRFTGYFQQIAPFAEKKMNMERSPAAAVGAGSRSRLAPRPGLCILSFPLFPISELRFPFRQL